MEINLDFNFNLINGLTNLLSLGIIFFFAHRVYKRNTEKPKKWKVVLVLFVGLFSFSINWNFTNAMVKIPILPLGVWILYFVLKGKNNLWQTYRSFAWLGFWANFLFLAFGLLATPIHQTVYPEKEASTFLTNMEHPSIIPIHPSAKDMKLKKDTLEKQLETMKKETIYSDQWYNDTYVNTEANKRSERFPYQLIGTTAEWGSGLSTVVYVEEDGKGLLITTPKKQFYFRTNQPFLEAVKSK